MTHARQLDAVDALERAAQKELSHSTILTSDVMDLARGGEKLVQDVPLPFSMLSVFQQVHDIVRPMAEERGLARR